jgi:hypothetical protein
VSKIFVFFRFFPRDHFKWSPFGKNVRGGMREYFEAHDIGCISPFYAMIIVKAVIIAP